jgi:hypothetical protein
MRKLMMRGVCVCVCVCVCVHWSRWRKFRAFVVNCDWIIDNNSFFLVWCLLSTLCRSKRLLLLLISLNVIQPRYDYSGRDIVPQY